MIVDNRRVNVARTHVVIRSSHVIRERVNKVLDAKEMKNHNFCACARLGPANHSVRNVQ